MAQIIVQLSPLWGQWSETEAPWSLLWDKAAHECGEQARASTVQHGSRSSTAAGPASPRSSWPELISGTGERRCIRCQEDCPSVCHPWLIVVRDFKRNHSRHQKYFLIFFSYLSHLVKYIFLKWGNTPLLADSNLSCTLMLLLETSWVILNFIFSGILKHEFLSICSTTRADKLWDREKIREPVSVKFYQHTATTHLFRDCPRLTSALSSWVKELRQTCWTKRQS